MPARERGNHILKVNSVKKDKKEEARVGRDNIGV